MMNRNAEEDVFTPSPLEFLTEMNDRDVLDNDQKQELYRLERGVAGEQIVRDYLEEFGQEDWVVLTNLWLYEYGLFEIDCLLLTDTDIYLFEIKNYNGDFKYINSQCYFSEDVISHNPISQTQRCKVNLQNILAAAGIRLNVNAVLIFTGEHADIDIQDYIEDLDVLTINQFRKLIYAIADTEREKLNSGQRKLNHRRILQIIQRGKRKSPYQPKPLTVLEQAKLRKGIKCAKCGRFDLDTARAYLICSCGLHEPREMAIVRTICEYGLINFDKDLIPSEVCAFFGGGISVKTIKRYLEKYFKPDKTTYHSKFYNPARSFDNQFDRFKFKSYRYYKF